MGLGLFSSSSADKSASIFSRWKEDEDVKTRFFNVKENDCKKNHLKQRQKKNRNLLSKIKRKRRSLPNPKPDNYTIIRHEVIGEYLIIEIQYLDCTNYEGRKTLVFNCQLQDLLNQKLIDPHFSESKSFISPIARFEPTERGWEFAILFVKQIPNTKQSNLKL